MKLNSLSHAVETENPNFQNHTHCVVSEDSDAILLALTVNPTMDVFVSGAQRLVFSARMFNEELAMSLNPGQKCSARKIT